MRSKEQKAEYDMAFIRSKCVKKTVLFHKDKDLDILTYLDGKKGNFNAFIKEAIRQQMKRETDE